MLFRNFMVVTAAIALMGIALLNVLEATHPANKGFQIGERLNEWKLHEAKQACQTNLETCRIITQLTVA